MSRVWGLNWSFQGYVEMVVPPDGGWGWVIVAASFMCNLVVDGIIFSYGEFLKPIAKEFGVEDARVALAGSLQSGFYLMAGKSAGSFQLDKVLSIGAY